MSPVTKGPAFMNHVTWGPSSRNLPDVCLVVPSDDAERSPS